MDATLRNILRNTVTRCRKLLEGSISEKLEGDFGIHADGTIETAVRLSHLSPEEQEYRERIVVHLKHIQAAGLKPKESVAQLVREAAFTHLNRLCAYKMMAARKLIDDPVGKVFNSRGFIFFLAEHKDAEDLFRGGEQARAYRRYFEWLNAKLSEEIGVLFAPDDLASGLFPPHTKLEEVLQQINSDELKDVWREDETIGWVYQYFTPDEMRRQVRRESAAPRNSYELAFRNQFFTPRYVVEFLTDNTLGRTWYEMRKGETQLSVTCRYLVRRPNEVFLAEGESAPEEKPQANGEGETSSAAAWEQPAYIPHRAKKDPREIKVLDPASGSGHFLLYCFDLLTAIYEEAYAEQWSVVGGRKGAAMAVQSYRQLVAWQQAMELVKLVYRATQAFPRVEIYGLTSQLRRAAVSVPSNIAEGQGRKSTKDFLRHLSIAYGSLMEVETQILIAQEQIYLTPQQAENLLALTARTGRLINGLSNSLLKKLDTTTQFPNTDH